MKIRYLYIKNDKIELTLAEFEEIMEERYNEGYEAARSLYSDSAKSVWECPFRYTSCPYTSITSISPLQAGKAQPLEITYCEGTKDTDTIIASKSDLIYNIIAMNENALNSAITTKG